MVADPCPTVVDGGGMPAPTQAVSITCPRFTAQSFVLVRSVCVVGVGDPTGRQHTAEGSTLMPGRSDRSTRKPGPWRSDQPPPRGNLLHLIHGGASNRVIEALADKVIAELTEQAGWIAEPLFRGALVRYVRAEARARLLTNYILTTAAQDGPGKVPQRLWEAANASDNAAGKAAVELGLTPMSRANLANVVASGSDAQALLRRLIDEGMDGHQDGPGAPLPAAGDSEAGS
jgi:hypothetical protein